MTNAEALALQIDPGCDLDKAVPAIEAHNAHIAALARAGALGELKTYAEERAAAIVRIIGHEPTEEDLEDHEEPELAAYESFVDVAELCRGLMLKDREAAKIGIRLDENESLVFPIKGEASDGRVIHQDDVLTLHAGVLLINGKGP